MFIALLLFILGASVEAYIYFTKKHIGSYRNYIALIYLLHICSAVLLFIYSWKLGVIYTVIALYRTVNISRLYVKRLPEKHILSTGKRTFLVLYNLQLSLFLLYLVLVVLGVAVNVNNILLVTGVISLIAAVIVFCATAINISKSKPLQTITLSDAELPTLTVAIAARNETPTLVSCLESVLASEYPKLEIIVFDDNSQDTTAEIIRSFAQNGVRFVDWEKYEGEWLSKNRAYQTLLSQASGDLLLFMGVDVRLHEKSLKGIVEQFITAQSEMMTIIPRRTKSGFFAIFVQPIRYWWELALPDFIRHRPPALSTAWIVQRKSLESIGGFTSYKRSIIPEDHLAKHFNSKQLYSYTRTSKDMLVTTHKTFGSQWDTQIRTRYPHAHRRPETVLLQSLILLCFVVFPFLIVPVSIFYSLPGVLVTFSIIAVVLYILSHVIISVITNPVAGFFAPLNFPVAIFLDVIALHMSMYRYEFSKVIWKGRDVAPKKLKVIAKLPALEESIQDSEKTH